MPKAENKNADQAYAKLAGHFLKNAAVTQSDKFGKGLRLDGKVFAMLVKGELVVKLSEDDVSTLLRQKKGKPFKHGQKVMKEWLAIEADKTAGWLQFAKKAFEQAKASI